MTVGSEEGAARRVVLTRDLGELWLALLEGSRVVELVVREIDQDRWLGSIFKGRVTSPVPGVNAAFVSVGLERDLFTIQPEGGESSSPEFKPGKQILVQVVREAEGGKGARASVALTLPGWSLVLAPGGEHRGVSRKIQGSTERDRLRRVLEEIAPAGFGLIARTAAEGRNRQQLVAEKDLLVRRWERIAHDAESCQAPALIYKEGADFLSFLRDQLCLGLEQIVVEGQTFFEDLSDLAQQEFPGANLNLNRHEGPLPAVEAYGLDRALARARARSVRLPGGGRLVLERTEALVSIDVNSGRDVSGTDLEQTALRTNLEAAVEAARQVRLRDLAGLIVIDFIDMRRSSARGEVDDALEAAFRPDRSKKRILPLSEFCLSQISRQRRGLALEGHLPDDCSHCGQRRPPAPRQQARHLLRRLRVLARPEPSGGFLLQAPAAVIDCVPDLIEQWGEESGLPAMARIRLVEGEPGVQKQR